MTEPPHHPEADPPGRRKERPGARIIQRIAGDAPPEGAAQLPRAGLVNTASVTAAALVGLLILGVLYTLYFARTLLVPVAAAALLGFLLKPLIRLLRNVGIPEMLGTIVVFLTFIATIGVSAYLLAPPAGRMVSRLPEDAAQAELRLRGITRRVGEMREAVDEVASVSTGAPGEAAQPGVVRLAPELLSARIIGGARSLAVGAAASAFLLFLLLASGQTFLRRTISMLPTLDQQKRLVRIIQGIERELSVYLVTTSIINIALGTAVGFALFLIGVPNPVLWGVAVAVLNFVPYVGAIAGSLLLGLVALASIDDLGRALLAPVVYLALNALEAYVITPQIVGARFSINPVAVLVAVAFWGWIWGIPGAFLAVPILTATSIVCANIQTLRPIALILRA
jgi:predicted PurR-regulated permease PerM